MLTLCILFPTLTTKTTKQSQDHKNSTAAGPRPTVLKFLDPPLSESHHVTPFYLHRYQKMQNNCNHIPIKRKQINYMYKYKHLIFYF